MKVTKKFLSILLAVTMLFSLAVTAPVSAEHYFTTMDALQALRHSVGAVTLTAEEIALYDLDKDGRITTADALAILLLAVTGAARPPVTPPITEPPVEPPASDRGTLPPASPDSLRGAYAGVFNHMGVAVRNTPASQLRGGDLEFIKEHFNSLTAENEMKPENILRSRNWSNGRHINADLITVAEARERGYVIPRGYNETHVPVINFQIIEDFIKIAYETGFGVRFHTLVWHEATPEWFFRVNYTDDGAFVSETIMNRRMEFYIKTVMKLTYESKYGEVVYSWDVVNEYFALEHNKTSGWHQIYNGRDTYVINAFRYAHEQLEEMKLRDKVSLIYNDYNERTKTQETIDLIRAINHGGVKRCDGVGIQAHYAVDNPSVSRIAAVIDTFHRAGLEIQITELDVVMHERTLNEQARYYGELFSMLATKKRAGVNITSVTFWGLNDDESWLGAGDYFGHGNGRPLLFGPSNRPKPAFQSVLNARNTTWTDPRNTRRTMNFNQFEYDSHHGLTYSVNDAGALSVNFSGQHQEIKFNLPSNINLAACIEIAVNGISANGQTAVKFYDTEGKEAFVMWNNRTAVVSDWAIALTPAERNVTIGSIGIMSQDSNAYSATINSVTFFGIN